MPRNLFEYHPVLGYRFIPGLKARVRHEGGGYLVASNAAGFRCRHQLAPRAPGIGFRVVVVGDSYTAGDGVSNAFRFSDLLEGRLQEALGLPVEVLNFGLPGSGTDQQLLVFREFAAGLDFDLLLVVPMIENIVRNLDQRRLSVSAYSGELLERPKPYFSLDDGKLVLHQVPVPKETVEARPAEIVVAGGQAASARTLLRRAGQAVDRRFPGFLALSRTLRGVTHPPQYDDRESEGWRLMRAILAEFCREARRVPDRRVMFAPWPTFGHILGGIVARPYRERFAEFAADQGVAFVDVLPAFKRLPQPERRLCRFAVDDHPTRFGHRCFADAILPHVLAQLEGLRG